MSGPNEYGSEMIRFGESPGPEMPTFGEEAPEGAEAFGPPVAQDFVPPEAPEGASAPDKAKKGKKGKKKTKGGGRKKDAGGGGKKSPKLLVPVAIAALAFLASVVTALLILKPWAAEADQPKEPEESEPPETVEPSAEPTPTPTPPPTPTPTPAQEVTKGEAVEYIESLSPSVLGLEGESMEEYKVYPGERVVLVEDVPCTEVNVYSVTAVGTNDIRGRYLVTKTGPRRLFRLDTFTKQVTELPLSGGS